MVIKEKLESCESINFKGGQILIHEDEENTIIEVHTEMGWRMSKWSNPFRISAGRGGGSGEISCDARVAVFFSQKTYMQDKSNMETRAKERERKRDGAR